jgi:predicted nucleic acid-binding protein
VAQVIADTSIWVRAFRRPPSDEKDELDRLLAADGVATVGLIYAEIARGTRSREDLEVLEDKFSAVRWLETTEYIWRETGALLRTMREAGLSASLPDTVIAACALEYGCAVYSIDTDFARFPGVSLHMPPIQRPGNESRDQA